MRPRTASARPLRSAIVVLLTGLAFALLLTWPHLISPPPAFAGDPKCDLGSTSCVTFRLTLTGGGWGSAHVGDTEGSNDGHFDCNRQFGATTGTCSWDYYILPGSTRTVWVTGYAYPNVVGCIGTSCVTGPGSTASVAVTMTVGARAGKTVDFTYVDAHTVTVSKTGTGVGTVYSTPLGFIDCSTKCSTSYPGGVELQLNVKLADGSHVVDATIGGQSCWDATKAICSLFPSSDVTVLFNIAGPATPVPSKTPPPKTPAPTKTPTPTRTPRPSTPVASLSPSASPAPALPSPSLEPPDDSAAPAPSGAGSASAAVSVAPSPAVTLPPIATRGPSIDPDAAAGAGDMTPWLIVLLVTVVFTVGFALVRGRLRRGAWSSS